jgi:ATP-dependent Clp protease ATP-binding subunit ClpB
MNPEQLTHRTLEAIQVAGEYADNRKNPNLDISHLLLALSTQNDTVFSSLLQANDVNTEEFKSDLNKQINLLPITSAKIDIDSLRPSNSLTKVLIEAKNESNELGDTHISTEHILLAAIKSQPNEALWKQHGLDYNKLKKASRTNTGR